MDNRVICYSIENQHPAENIRFVQRELNYIRSFAKSPTWEYLNTDGVFNLQTRNAIMGFQKYFGLSPTGAIDSSLAEKLFKARQDITLAQRRNACTTNFPTIDEIMLAFKNVWSGICGNIVSIWVGMRKDMTNEELCAYLFAKIKSLLANKLSDFVESIKKTYPMLKQAPKEALEGIKAFLKYVKDYAYKLVQALKKDPKKLKDALFSKESVKSFAKDNTTGLVIAGIPMVYYMLRYVFLFRWPDEREYSLKQLKESTQSFINAAIVMAIIQLAAGLTVAIGASSLSVSVLAGIIGMVVAIIDILGLCIWGKGVGDVITLAFDYISNYIAEVTETVATKVGKTMSQTLEDLAWGYVNALNPMNLVGF